jgi:hypothetical protein
MRSDTQAAAYGRAFFRKVLVPTIEFIAAIGSQVMFYGGNVGRVYQHALGAGVSPASNLTSNLPQSTVTAYDKVFVENLKATTPWVRVTSRRMLDENAGNKLELFMYTNLAAPPVTTAPEGTIQTGLTVAVVTTLATIGNYADYANVSRVALQTALDPVLEQLGTQMAYRLAQVINTVIQNTADAASVVDPSVAMAAKATPLLTSDVTTMVASLAGVNALPLENGRYGGILHPFVVGDLLLDNANNGITDVLKRSTEGAEQLKELPSADGENVPILDWGGVSFYQSTLVTVRTDAPFSAGTPGYRTYVVGRDGIIGVSFGAKENTQIGEGNWRNMNVWVRRLTEPTGYDPSAMIGGFASYNTMYTAVLPPNAAHNIGGAQRIRFIDTSSAIT